MVAKSSAQPTPDRILHHYWGIGSTYVLVAAVELDIFSLLAAGRRTVPSIARAAKASTRGVRILLDALVGLQLLTKKGGEYELTLESETYLVASSPAYFGRMIKQGGQFASRVWSNLTATVRTGKQGASGDEQHFERFFPELVRALFPLSYMTAQAFCATISQQDRAEIRRVLDVAAGTGAWSLPLAQSIPEVKVTAIDFPLVLQVTREYAERFGVTDRYEMRPGNIREIDLGSGEFDLVIAGNICHSEGERHTRALLKKCYSAIREGGRLLVADVIPNDERTGPLLSLMFGVNMLLNTVEGDIFTLAQFDGWLKDLGFRSVEAVDVGGDSPLILARK